MACQELAVTAQAMDLCRFRGTEWAVAAIDGAWPVPTSRALGFATSSPSTGNYRGRIDELSVDENGILRLDVVEAH